MGWRNQPTRVISLSDVEIPASCLIGEEGQGFMIAMQGLDGGRIISLLVQLEQLKQL